MTITCKWSRKIKQRWSKNGDDIGSWPEPIRTGPLAVMLAQRQAGTAVARHAAAAVLAGAWS